MAIQISADDAAVVAAALGRAMEATVRRRAVNAVGKRLRRDLPAILAGEVPTTKRALHPRGRGARPGQDDPAYVLTINRRIRVEELRARVRKFKRRSRGSPFGKLLINVPTGTRRKTLEFQQARMEGTGAAWDIRLLAAGTLPERGLTVVLRRDLMSTPAARERVDDAGPELEDAALEEIRAVLTRRMGRRRRRR